MPGWEVKRIKGVVHVLPIADWHAHVLVRQCLCRPIVFGDDPIYRDRVIHNSYDGREYFEDEQDARLMEGAHA